MNRHLGLRNNLIYKASDHRMLTRSDQIQVLALNFIHHRVHLREAHDAVNNGAANHVRRDHISKSLVNHEITRVGKDSRMQSCDVSEQIIESVAGDAAGRIEIDAVERLHNFRVVRNFKIRNNRFAKLLNLNILTVILANRNTWINNIRNDHHTLINLLCNLCLFCRQFIQLIRIFCHLSFHRLGLFLFALSHKSTNHLGILLAKCPQIIRSLLCLPALLIQFNDLIYHRQLTVLKFILNILLYYIRIFSQKLDI